MKKLFLLILLNVVMLTAFAQSHTVHGVVIDSQNGEPLIGVTVMPVGGGQGTATDVDGKFSISIAPNVHSLKFSYVGMEPLTLKAETGREMTVRMASSDKTLDEVFVVAYGTSTKSAYTGSAGVVDATQLEDRLVTDVTSALSGTVAGVQLQSKTGQPGSEPTIRIRGVGSINAGMNPLYVVDGIPYDGGITSINPQDVESITVLKDAASAALYGARGANGVILVTTKKGRSGKAKVTFDARWGANSRQVPRYEVVTSPTQYVQAVYNARRNYALSQGLDEAGAYQWALNATDGLNQGPGANCLGYQMWTIPEGGTLINPDGTISSAAKLGYVGEDYYLTPDDWQKGTYRNGFRQEYNLSIQGGNEMGSYMISGAYLDDQGSIVESSFKRATVRATGEYNIFKWLKVGTNMQYAYENSNSPEGQTDTGYSGNVTYLADYIAPIYPMYLRGADGKILTDPETGRDLYDYGMKGLGLPFSRAFLAGGNPTGTLYYDKSEYLYDTFNGKWFVNINPIEGLNLTATAGYYLSNMRNNYFANSKYGQNANSGGNIFQQTERISAVNLQYLANYRRTFADHHNLDVLLGYEQYERRQSGI